MYNMYPNYAETMKERGEGGLGHYDYPVDEKPPVAVPETEAQPQTETVLRVERGAGYVTVKEMVVE